MTIGVYGGSFDPVHTGHAMLANFVAQCNVVDRVWIMVSRRNPLKENSIVSDSHRLVMARLVASRCRNVEFSEVEMSLPSPSYTIDTLKELKRLFPQHDFKWIIGSDSLENFHNWKNYTDILRDFGVIVYPRPGFPLQGEEPSGMQYLNGAPEFGISSSLIREYIKSGWNIDYFVPVEVAEYIKKHNLYQ